VNAVISSLFAINTSAIPPILSLQSLGKFILKLQLIGIKFYKKVVQLNTTFNVNN
jgi:hypothetical protein